MQNGEALPHKISDLFSICATGLSDGGHGCHLRATLANADSSASEFDEAPVLFEVSNASNIGEHLALP